MSKQPPVSRGQICAINADDAHVAIKKEAYFGGSQFFFEREGSYHHRR